MDRKSIGNFIAVLRKANGMTQRELAEKLNVSDKAISRWERDECAPDLTLIPVIAELFNVTADELLRGERIQGYKENREKTDGQTLRRVKAILSNTERRFKNQSLISSSIAAAGYICMMAIGYSFYKPIVGFAVCFIFSLAAVIMEVIFLNNAVFSIHGISDEWSEAVGTTMKRLKKTASIVIGIDVGFIIIGLPLLLYRTYDISDSIISWRSYWYILPVFLCLTSLIITAMWLLVTGKGWNEVKLLIQSWYSFKGMPMPHIFIVRANIQRTGFILVVLLIIVGAKTRREFIIYTALSIVLILTVLVTIPAMVMLIIKIEEHRGRLFALVYGVKNLLYCWGLAIICRNYYFEYYGDSGSMLNYGKSLEYNMNNNGVWILFISGVAYLVIKHYLIKKDAA